MEVIKENLKDILEYLGGIKDIYGVLVFIMAFFMAIVWFKWNTVSKWIVIVAKYFLPSKSNPEDKRVLKDLLGHAIFYRCEDIRQEIKEMGFTTHGDLDLKKTNLLHTLIDCQLDVIKESLTNMLDDDRNNNLSIEEMRNTCMELKTNITNMYCSRAKSIFVNEHNILEVDAEFLLDSYTRYRRNFNSHFEVQMLGIVNNPVYDTNYKKVSVLFEVISMSLYSIPSQSKVAMDAVNGRFKKYK